MRGARSVAPCLVAVLVSLVSCTGAPPEATRASIDVAYVENRELDAVYESGTLEVHVQDADGIDDIETLHLVHDGSGLVWTAEKGSWSRRSEGGTELFVVDGLSTPDGSPLPRGEYRVIAVDAAGHDTQTTASMAEAPVEEQALSFPEVTLTTSTLRVDGPFERVRIRGYTADGRSLGELRQNAGEVRDIRNVGWMSAHEGRLRIYVSGVDRSRGLTLVTGPYRR
jgi:hypothetical protein